MFGFQRKSRAEAAAAKKASVTAEEDEDDEEEEEEPMGLLTGIAKPNPNRMKKQERNIKIKNLDDTAAPADPTAGLTRKEKLVLVFLYQNISRSMIESIAVCVWTYFDEVLVH